MSFLIYFYGGIRSRIGYGAGIDNGTVRQPVFNALAASIAPIALSSRFCSYRECLSPLEPSKSVLAALRTADNLKSPLFWLELPAQNIHTLSISPPMSPTLVKIDSKANATMVPNTRKGRNKKGNNDTSKNLPNSG